MPERNFRREYLLYHSKPEQIKRRASRNKARRKMVVMGRAKKGDGKDVDHKNRNAMDNRKSNLRVVAKSTNRGYKR